MFAVACPPPFPNGGPVVVMAAILLTGLMMRKRHTRF